MEDEWIDVVGPKQGIKPQHIRNPTKKVKKELFEIFRSLKNDDINTEKYLIL